MLVTQPRQSEIKPTSLAASLAKETGGSIETAKKDVLLAKRFTEEELNDLTAADVGRNDLLAIAEAKDEAQRKAIVKAACAGLPVREAIASITASPEDVKKLAADKARLELSDEDWLERYCGEFRQNLQDATRYDRDAILYRHSRKDRSAVASHHKKEAIKARQRGFHPFAQALLRVFYVEHPIEWCYCFECAARTLTIRSAPNAREQGTASDGGHTKAPEISKPQIEGFSKGSIGSYSRSHVVRLRELPGPNRLPLGDGLWHAVSKRHERARIRGSRPASCKAPRRHPSKFVVPELACSVNSQGIRRSTSYA